MSYDKDEPVTGSSFCVGDPQPAALAVQYICITIFLKGLHE